MRINVETPKEPCCEKCGQSLPAPPPLTTRERIERLAKVIAGLKPSLCKVALADIAEILTELEARPAVNFNPLWSPPIQTAPLPNVYPPIYPPASPTYPTTGDPLPSRWPTVTCRNAAEKTSYPHAKIEAVSDATGYVPPAGDSRHD